ncbi:hypothetical protein [Aeoliella mucimassa]|uniref:Uncharacterized protein n=1 Tax=Aeoliella mucimassa TaxID=2527972 RepID=A0A518AWL7_9BACT|nr:hypothetical protein [Aeoliella mucimassa]QDU59129.1 hypothetical protein Pan181_53700 [Aeoliella mucimassa]
MNLLDLWLPIVLTGVATHIASTIAWTALKHHDPEWNKLPVEDDLLDFVDAKQVSPQQYLFPYCDDMKEMGTPEFKEKLRTRCTGMLVLWKRPPHMGKAIASTLTYFLVVAILTGYVASIAFAPGASRIDVFRLVFTVGVLCHAFSPLPFVFWFPRKYVLEMVDGVVYALVTAGIFAGLWPGA